MNLPNRVKIHLSKKVYDKIRHLCNTINKVEWSGCIFYSIKGTLLKPSELEVNVLDLIPLDKGTTGFTSYNFDERVLNHMMKNEYFELKIGHIHSHHDMKTFFSGTDSDELNENSEFINPYLSLIVNNAGDYSCKLAFRGKSSKTSLVYEFLDVDAKRIDEVTLFKSQQPQEVVFSYDCDVINPKIELEDKDFENQLSEILKPKGIVPAYNIGYGKGYTPIGVGFDFEKESWRDSLITEEEFVPDAHDDFSDLYVYLLGLGSVPKEHNIDLETMFDNIDKVLFDKKPKIKEIRKFCLKFFEQLPSKLIELEMPDEFVGFLMDSLIDEIEFSTMQCAEALIKELEEQFVLTFNL